MIIIKSQIYRHMIGVLLLAGLGSCAINPGANQATANSNFMSSEQSKVGDVKLQDAWDDKTKGLNKQLKDYPAQKLAALQSLLAQAPEQQVKNESERIALSPVSYTDLNEYEQTLAQALVVSKISAQDRMGLVALLSSKCPASIGATPIELYLSMTSTSDPLLVLFDSYETTTNAQTKKDLLSVLGHAFRSIREMFSRYDQFVTRSKAWYLQNHAKLQLNPNYHPDSLFAENRELFVVKSNGENH